MDDIAALLGGSALTGTCSTKKLDTFYPLQATGGRHSSRKYRDIRDYISAKNSFSDSMFDSCGTIRIGSTELAIKDSKQLWDKIRLTHYMEASLRVLRTMVTEEQINVNEMK